MPKVEIDYSNTVFYKIYCIDPSINELYIGHTTNFIQRKHAHKQSCLNITNKNYNCKLYSVIRDNNGWDNWRMEIIAFHNCENLMIAKKYEQVYFEQYKATLNSIEPMPKHKPKIIKETTKKEKQIFYCSACNVHFTTNKLHEIHNETKKHYKNTKKTTELSPQDSYEFICDLCNYTCLKKGDFNKHLQTIKHNKSKNTTNTTTLQQKLIYRCQCGKSYNHRATLYNHKKCCKTYIGTDNISANTNTNTNTTTVIDKPNEFQLDNELLIKMLLKNEDVLEKMMEILLKLDNN
mgnify:CR=1 FL=1